MKEKLDVIWNDSRIACPNHLVRWNTKGNGYSVWGKIGIYFTKGTLRRPKIKKIKGKGYSWLMKGYAFYRAAIIK